MPIVPDHLSDRVAVGYDGVTYVLASGDLVFINDVSAAYDRPCPLSVLVTYLQGVITGASIPWDYYANNWSVEPSFNATITGGDVYDYTLDGTTRYRFVPSPYDPTEDKFYLTFDGVNLTNLVIARG